MEARDPRVDEYLATLPDWQQELAERLRQLIHEADAELVETIKRTRFPYYVLDGNVCAFLGARDHFNLFIYDPTVADPAGLINQGHGNKSARSIQFWCDDGVRESDLLDLLRAVIARNRAGGWRKLG